MQTMVPPFGEIPMTSVRCLISQLSRLIGFVGCSFAGFLEGHDASKSSSAPSMMVAGFGNFGLIGDNALLSACRLWYFLSKSRCYNGGHNSPAALCGMREHVPHEVDTAPLPGGAQNFGDWASSPS